MKNFELRDSSGVVFAYVSKEKDQPWLYIRWVGDIKTEELKHVMLQYIDVLKDNKYSYVLSDRRQSTGNVFEINHFIEHKWSSMAVDAGLQCVANVTAPEVTSSKFTSTDLASRIIGFEFKSFDSIEEAEEWLTQKAVQAQH